MYNFKISVFTIFILLVLLYLHKYAISYHLYTQIWFYDIIMHFLGGAGIAMSIYCIIIFFNININLWQIITLTIIAGIGWEFFEIAYNLSGSNYDTLQDLIMDTLGAVVVWKIIENKR